MQQLPAANSFLKTQDGDDMGKETAYKKWFSVYSDKKTAIAK